MLLDQLPGTAQSQRDRPVEGRERRYGTGRGLITGVLLGAGMWAGILAASIVIRFLILTVR